ncbi:MAG: hypothetical protein IKI37_06710, partial [Oscillospiraceae bacterium]|nr:hypothetical protein [Oscillospiraceae bacterium]
VLENANESNNFLIDDLNRLTSSGVSPEQKHVQEKETVRIKAVKNAYQDYQKQLKNQIVQKIREGNLKFIKTNQEIVSKFSDIYGMNALMYAALYQKKEIFDYLISLGIKVEQKNILDMNILNLSRLGSKNLDDYLNFVGKDWDLGYSKRYQAYQEKIAELKEEIQKQERNEKFLNATEKFSNGMSRIADRNGNAAASSSAELWANRASEEAYRAAEAKETAQYELDHAEENFRNEIQEYYQEVCTNAWNRLAGYTSAAKVNVSDVAFPPQPDFSGEQILPENTELEGYPPEYHELFATLQRNFISEYVSQHLPKLEPRGEFETTAQYKAREENHLAEKEKLAAEAEKQFQTEGLQRIREEYLFDIEARHKRENREYQDRIKMHKKNIKDTKQKNLCIDFARSILEFFCFRHGNQLALGKYDPDNQHFMMTYHGFWKKDASVQLNIPIEIAPDFKNAMSGNAVPFVIDTVNLADRKADCHVSFQEKTYSFIIPLRFPENLRP